MVLVSFILTSLAGTVMFGTYPVRPFLFLGYVLLLVSVTVCLARVRAADAAAHALWRRAAGGVLIALVAAYGLGTYLQISLLDRYDIPQRANATFITQEAITDTRLAHVHVGKTALSLLMGAAPAIERNADTGSALVPYVAAPAVWAYGFLVLIAILGSLGAGAAYVRTLPSGRRRVASALLYAFITCYALEKAVDGGIVSDAAGLALVAFAALTLLPHSHFYRAIGYGAIVYGGILGLLYGTGWYWSPYYFAYTLAHLATFLGVMWALERAAYGTRLSSARAIAGAGALVLVVALGSSRSMYQYLAAPAVFGHGYVATLGDAEIDLAQIGSIGRLKVYAVPDQPLSVKDLIQRYALPYWYKPISVEQQACGTMQRQMQFTALSAEPLAGSVSGSLAHASFVYEGERGPGWLWYTGSITYDACVPRRYDLLAELLRLAGTRQAIVYDLTIRGVPPEPVVDKGS